MKSKPTLEFLLKFFEITSMDLCDEFFWRTDGTYAPLTIFANVSDCFYWGCGDTEEITPENIGAFEQAVKDAREADTHYGYIYSQMLFACRIRKMRPQGCWYENFNPSLAALFDACGPERDPKEFGNTPRKKYKKD